MLGAADDVIASRLTETTLQEPDDNMQQAVHLINIAQTATQFAKDHYQKRIADLE